MHTTRILMPFLNLIILYPIHTSYFLLVPKINGFTLLQGRDQVDSFEDLWKATSNYQYPLGLDQIQQGYKILLHFGLYKTREGNPFRELPDLCTTLKNLLKTNQIIL